MLRSIARAMPRRLHHRHSHPALASTFLPSLSSSLSPHRSFATFPIAVPSLGDSITEGTIVEVTKATGDSVDTDEVVARLETDKVTIDLRSSGKGRVTAVKVKQGDVVHPGDVVFEADDSADGASHTPAPKAAAAKGEAPETRPPPKEEKAPASPAPAAAPAAPTRMQAIDAHEEGEAHGRQPLIHFRYGKRPSQPSAPHPAPPSTSKSPAPASAPSSSSSPMSSASYFNPSGWREANEAAANARRSLPKSYHRVPRLTEVEQEVVMMGGAQPYVPKKLQMELDKAKAKGDKPSRK